MYQCERTLQFSVSDHVLAIIISFILSLYRAALDDLVKIRSTQHYICRIMIYLTSCLSMFTGPQSSRIYTFSDTDCYFYWTVKYFHTIKFLLMISLKMQRCRHFSWSPIKDSRAQTASVKNLYMPPIFCTPILCGHCRIVHWKWIVQLVHIK